MEFSGTLHKMSTELGEVARYFLTLSEELLLLNPLIGRNIQLEHLGYQCLNCAQNKEIFRMGYCKNCFFSIPETNESILKPELSTAHLGIEKRNLEKEQLLELQPHIVYIAYTGEPKIGVTRESQIPTRWIDQGASVAIPIARTSNRYQAGIMEVEAKNYISDKTHWKKMLSSQGCSIDLVQVARAIQEKLSPLFSAFLIQEKTTSIVYPCPELTHIKSHKLLENSTLQGKLIGIKGQYLAFEGGVVINIRAHEGFVVRWSIPQEI